MEKNILRTFRTDEELFNDFKMICLKERIDLGDKLNEFITDYVKVHKDGNPQYTIDQFEDPNFMACPAFYRDSEAWKSYLKQASTTELENVKSQIILIDHQLGRVI